MAFKAVKRRKTQPKKRSAQHHNYNHHYVKHYWPYLPMALIASLGIVFSSVLPLGNGVLGVSSDLSPTTLLNTTNQVRQAESENKLSLNDTLNQAAQAKADDMVAKNYWSHVSPAGDSPWSFMTEAGYQYKQAGENLAFGFDSSKATLNAWMNSASHKANVLNADYSQVGFGIAESKNFAGHGPAAVIVAFYGVPSDSVGPLSYSQTSSATGIKGLSTESSAVSRMAALSGTNATLLPLVASVIVTIALVVFLLRHGRFLHGSLVRGERFVLKHPVLDFALVAVITLGFVMSRSVGFIL